MSLRGRGGGMTHPLWPVNVSNAFYEYTYEKMDLFGDVGSKSLGQVRNFTNFYYFFLKKVDGNNKVGE